MLSTFGNIQKTFEEIFELNCNSFQTNPSSLFFWLSGCTQNCLDVVGEVGSSSSPDASAAQIIFKRALIVKKIDRTCRKQNFDWCYVSWS